MDHDGCPLAMNRLTAFLSRIVNAPEWRDIATAPADRAVELAVIDGEIDVLNDPFLRHGDVWLDAATLQPVSVAATHWRYRHPDIVPVGCC
jgi:hypothetical protein